MISFTHILTLSSLKWKSLHFLLSRINKLNRDVFHWQVFFTCFPPEKPREIAFIPSVLERVQRWRVSWIRSILEKKKSMACNYKRELTVLIVLTVFTALSILTTRTNALVSTSGIHTTFLVFAICFASNTFVDVWLKIIVTCLLSMLNN